MEDELWKKLIYPKIPDELNRFEISNFGRLRNVKTGHIYKPYVLNTGYCSVRTTLGKKDAKIHILLHKAVAYTFLANPNNLPEVNHKDGIRCNNFASNLEWCSSHENQQHKYDTGHFDIRKISGSNNHNAKLNIEDVIFIRKYCNIYTRRELACKFNVSKATINSVIKYHTWRDVDDNYFDLVSNSVNKKRNKKRNEIEKQIRSYIPTKEEKKYFCKECGQIIVSKTLLCTSCRIKRNRKVKERPTLEELSKDIFKLGFLGTGRKYGVSDNAIRKWCNSFGIPNKKQEFKQWYLLNT